MSTQTPGNIATAQSEYYRRPADERFETLSAMLQSAQQDRDLSREAHYNLKDLQAIVQPLSGSRDNIPAGPDAASTDRLMIASPRGQASLTHYAFGQLARTIGAPASYLRTLPPELAARNINHGLQASPAGTVANLLVRSNGSNVIRACTSETYGRLWNAPLLAELDRHMGDGKRSAGGEWITPPVWPGQPPGGNYMGDRDMFCLRVNGGSIVTDPTIANSSPTAYPGHDGRMYRGLLIRNSEVGHCSVTVECVLFRFVCGNHMLWGAIVDRQFKRRHVGTKITRDTMREINELAWKFNQRTASQDEQIIKSLIQHEIAHTKEAVIDELKKMGATKEQATEAYATAEEKESASPRSFWGLAQGFTRNSQESGYQDERMQLDTFAAQLLKRGALLTV